MSGRIKAVFSRIFRGSTMAGRMGFETGRTRRDVEPCRRAGVHGRVTRSCPPDSQEPIQMQGICGDEMPDPRPIRLDLHCHSTASERSKLGVQRALGLPECATPPEEVYALAKRRGMDFVTITDHDTIDGALEIADRADAFVSRGADRVVPRRAAGGPRPLPRHHARRPRRGCRRTRATSRRCAAYLHEHEIACALAHPFYAVAAPLRLATGAGSPSCSTSGRCATAPAPRSSTRPPRSTSRPTAAPASAAPTTTRGSTSAARTPRRPPRRRRPSSSPTCAPAARRRHGEQGSAAKWAHAAMALAVRALGRGEGAERLDPARRARDGRSASCARATPRRGALGADLAPDDARAPAARLAGRGRARRRPARAARAAPGRRLQPRRRCTAARGARHERKLARALADATAAPRARPALAGAAMAACSTRACPRSPTRPRPPSSGARRASSPAREGEPPRVALVADGVGATHGVTHTSSRRCASAACRASRSRSSAPTPTSTAGWRRRRGRAAVLPGPAVGVPSLPAVVEALAEGRYDLVHVCSPGPAGARRRSMARRDRRCRSSAPTTPSSPRTRALRSGDARPRARVRGRARRVLRRLRRRALAEPGGRRALSRRSASTPSASRAGTAGSTPRASRPAAAARPAPGGRINVLYAGPADDARRAPTCSPTRSSAARGARPAPAPRAWPAAAPRRMRLRERLGEHATFLGWLTARSSRAPTRAPTCSCSRARTDTFGQVLLEAQASGLPVVAVDAGGPRSSSRTA